MNRQRALLFTTAAVGWYLLQSLSIMNDAPPASPDGAVFADAARNLATSGHPGTNLVVGMKDHVYWQPPGYLLALAATFRLFGYGLWQLRLLSLAFGAGCLWMVYALSMKLHDDRLTALVAVVILAFDPLFAKWARWDRMDPICMFLVLLSVFFYLTALEKPRRRWLFLAGTSASAAMLVHPNGAISVIVLGLHAVFVRKPSRGEIAMFFIPLVLLFIGWAMYVAQDPGEFAVQMQYQMDRKLQYGGGAWLAILSQYRFVPTYIVIVIGALTFAYWSLKKSGELRNALVAIAVLVVLCSYLFIKGPYYHTYLAPVLGLAASPLLVKGLRSEQRMRKLVATLLSLLVLNGIAYALSMTWLYQGKLKREASHRVLVQRILQYLPPRTSFGHFGYPTPYWALNDIHESDRLREMYFLHPGHEGEVFDGIEYLVFTQSSNPLSDDAATRRDVDFSDAVLGREGKRLRFVAAVGEQKTNAYRALIYSIESGYNVAGGGEYVSPWPVTKRLANLQAPHHAPSPCG